MSSLQTALKSLRKVNLVLGWEVHRQREEKQHLTFVVSSSDPGTVCERENATSVEVMLVFQVGGDLETERIRIRKHFFRLAFSDINE